MLSSRAEEISGGTREASYRVNSRRDHSFEVLSSSKADPPIPDATAIILNWSRPQNVVLIASVLCRSSLDGIIAEVFVWNNNPNATLSLHAFQETGCPSGKIRIFNSPENLYFQARFLACSQVRTPFCFIQDDDYVIRPEIIKSMHAFYTVTPNKRSIHLLPPHEHSLSRLRTVQHSHTKVVTTFAWLGHGTFVAKSSVSEFLKRLHFLQLPEDELRMADNYFTILRAQLPEIWLDQGIELAGGEPFTVGEEGHIRNTNALRYLDSLLDVESELFDRHENGLCYYQRPTRAPFRLSSNVVETNIYILSGIKHDVTDMSEMLSTGAQNRKIVGDERLNIHSSAPLSYAVDGVPHSAFLSAEYAKDGDYVSVDMLQATERHWRTVEMAWLVDGGTEGILRSCEYSQSIDGIQWTPIANPVVCHMVDSDTIASGHSPVTINIAVPTTLSECSIVVQDSNMSYTSRYFRATFRDQGERTVHEKWRIHEVWLRGVRVEG
ncbi:hypothetical protein BD410DRAFT_835322 [Rickenella mellea]|uniref:Uncharacterized protein n=1 Tax=Rickenella mellea TaxID=50990 RepID=A0A4Y7QLJ3_9AGAM|nr:hypothetical protein BD410DRAFT_835322 [Rickenella mellea]